MFSSGAWESDKTVILLTGCGHPWIHKLPLVWRCVRLYERQMLWQCASAMKAQDEEARRSNDLEGPAR